jgi:hypothetical protein
MAELKYQQLTSFMSAVLISVSRSAHSSTWFPAIPRVHKISPQPDAPVKPFQITFNLNVRAGATTKQSDRRLVMLNHQRTEHGTRRGAVAVSDNGNVAKGRVPGDEMRVSATIERALTSGRREVLLGYQQ